MFKDNYMLVVWKFKYLLIFFLHVICSELWLLLHSRWGSELNLGGSFQPYAFNFPVKLSPILTTIDSITGLIFMMFPKHICPFNLPKTCILCGLVGNVGGHYRGSQAGAIRPGNSLSKPFLCELLFQMSAYTCNLLCKDHYYLLILKSQRITVVCIKNQLVS